MSDVIIRMWTKEGCHKDIIVMDEKQIHMGCTGTEARLRHIVQPIDAVRVVIDPKQFPEAIEFEVIVRRTQK